MLKLIDEATPREQNLHLIVDNYATHNILMCNAGSGGIPAFTGILRRPVPPGSIWSSASFATSPSIAFVAAFSAIFDLITAIDEYVDRHNNHPKAYIWTASASDILEKVKRARAALNGHSA